MANKFDGYQIIRRDSRYIYTTKQIADEFRTKRLLGLKRIKIKGILTQDADYILDLQGTGVKEVWSEYNECDLTQSLHFLLE